MTPLEALKDRIRKQIEDARRAADQPCDAKSPRSVKYQARAAMRLARWQSYLDAIETLETK